MVIYAYAVHAYVIHEYTDMNTLGINVVHAWLEVIMLEQSSLRSRLKVLIIALWLLALLSFWLYARQQADSPLDMLRRWLSDLSGNPWAMLLLLGMYVLRPLLLIPISLLTLSAGFLFGAVWGFLYAMTAMLLSTAVAYVIGRFLGRKSSSDLPMSKRWLVHLRQRGFESVLIGRFLLLPGDLVSYAAGLLRVHFPGFMLASAIGGLPGLLMAVLAGAAVEDNLQEAQVEINVPYLIASLLLLILSIGAAQYLRRSRLLTRWLGEDDDPDEQEDALSSSQTKATADRNV